MYTFDVDNENDCMDLFYQGVRNKTMASHKLNKASSRSHTIFSMNIERINTEEPDDVIRNKLQLVDLAGSERLSYVSNDKTLNKECIEINKSLFTLRQVITSLSDKITKPSKSNHVIPYRESKLTCLLKQCLGGNSFCLMIACLAPCDLYIDDNVNTLNYAAKAQVISNAPIVNDDPKIKKMKELQLHVSTLTGQLKQANKAIEFFKNMIAKDGKVDTTGTEGPEVLTKMIDNLNQNSNPKRLQASHASHASLPKTGKPTSGRQTSPKGKNNDQSDEESGNFYTNRSIEKGINFNSAQKDQNQDFSAYLKGEASKLQQIAGINLMELDKNVLVQKVYD